MSSLENGGPPLHRRTYHAFLSHAHADRDFVDQLDKWCQEVAGLRIWYDARDLTVGALPASRLPLEINKCRGMIIVISREAIKSRWVEEEYNYAVAQQRRYPHFALIALQIEDCILPGFLPAANVLRLPNALDVNSAFKILKCFYPATGDAGPDGHRDVYVSRSWHEHESAIANRIVELLHENEFRLLGDAGDHVGEQDYAKRVTAIIRNCGCFVAVMPFRDNDLTTSKGVLDEIDIAISEGRPLLVIYDGRVRVPEHLKRYAIEVAVAQATGDFAAPEVGDRVQDALLSLKAEYRRPSEPQYVFYDSSPTASGVRVEHVRHLIHGITSLPCTSREDVRGNDVQKTLLSKIGGAFRMIADIAAPDPDLWLAAGSALASDRMDVLIRQDEGRPIPMLLQNRKIERYATDLERLGCLHRVMYDHRRRVMNHEIFPRSWQGGNP